MRAKTLVCCLAIAVVCGCAGIIRRDSHRDFTPIVRFVDLNIGESQVVTLSNGKTVRVKLLDVKTRRDTDNHVWRSTAVVDIDGEKADVIMTTFNLPKTVGNCQIDCIATKNYVDTSFENYWEIHKDARFRLWPKGSPWIEPGTFMYPVANSRWLAANVGYSNVPAAPRPNGKFYYHAGMDTGGVEKITPVVAATDGLVVQLGTGHLSQADHPPILPRYDVIYLRDDRGWYYRYSHLSFIDPSLKLGERVKMGRRLGYLGKEGESGGWTHLHFEIKTPTPDGKLYGTQDAYAYFHQGYREQYRPPIMAVAQPRTIANVGEEFELDASRSWSEKPVRSYEWLIDGETIAEGIKVPLTYGEPGSHQVRLKVTDIDGNYDYDFSGFNVSAPGQARISPRSRDAQTSATRATRRRGAGVQAFFYPSLDVKPGDPVVFSSRGNGGDGFDHYDFDDGTTTTVRSNIDMAEHAENGYAFTVHHFAKPGHYFVKVTRTDPTTGRTGGTTLDVPVGMKP
ncbi:peptidoglycan DD-metalloendopeptidase family protein [bacterium]|nr:peptidoglycan DD-metalloendopeptidase family protein [bacterium]